MLMKNILSSVKKKVISRYLTKDIGVDEVKNIQNNKVKSTDINILLNRVREDKKKEGRKKLLFTAAASAGVLMFGVLIF